MSPTDAPFPDVKGLSEDLYQQWEKSMTAWWDQVLESPSFLDATNKNVAGMARMRARYEEQVDEQLMKLHLPTRGDMTRLARIATLLEKRLLEMEDTILELRDGMATRDAAIARLEKETIQARIEAAEARLELRAKLDELAARFEGAPTEGTEAAAKVSKPATKKG